MDSRTHRLGVCTLAFPAWQAALDFADHELRGMDVIRVFDQLLLKTSCTENAKPVRNLKPF